jgi:NAD(P)H-dependent FMN reductase
MHTLGIVIGSVREGRAGRSIADWFARFSESHGAFRPTVLDLREVDLPLLDEPAHPRLQQYTQPGTRRWSAAVAAQDAFVFVTPEYNFGSPPALVNALDHLYAEWHYKPVGFVSYGGVSGGLRSVQMTKQIVTALRMMPLPEAVVLPLVAPLVDVASGAFAATEVHGKAAQVMLDELARWTAALKTLR